MAEKTPEERAHQLGDEFRGRAEADERKFLNWIAVACAGGITLALHFMPDGSKSALAYPPPALVPPLVLWIAGIMLAGVSQFSMLREQLEAGSMFHAVGRRERQKAKAEKAGDPSPERDKALGLAKDYHDEADRRHVISRRWLGVRASTLISSTGCFAIGTAWAAAVLARLHA